MISSTHGLREGDAPSPQLIKFLEKVNTPPPASSP